MKSDRTESDDDKLNHMMMNSSRTTIYQNFQKTKIGGSENYCYKQREFDSVWKFGCLFYLPENSFSRKVFRVWHHLWDLKNFWFISMTSPLNSRQENSVLVFFCYKMLFFDVIRKKVSSTIWGITETNVKTDFFFHNSFISWHNLQIPPRKTLFNNNNPSRWQTR